MFFWKKTSKYKMNSKQAEDTLSNVFKACNIKELVQEVSLKEIQEKQRKENKSYRVILSIAFVFLLLLLISPFAFHKPAADFQTQSNSSGLQIFQHHVEDSIFHLTLSGSDIDYEHIEIYTSVKLFLRLLMIEKRIRLLFHTQTKNLIFSFRTLMVIRCIYY